MTTVQLAAVFRDVEKAGTESAETVAAFEALASSLVKHTGIGGLRIHVVENPEDGNRPPGAIEVVTVENPRRGLPTAAAIDKLRVFDKPAVLGDLREVIHQLYNGPCTCGDTVLAAGEHGLVVRVRMEMAVIWVILFAKRAWTEEQIDGWNAALPLLLNLICGKDERLNVRTPLGRRRRFYQTLLNQVPADPEGYMTEVCRAWRTANGADWVWLWIYNPNGGTYELSALAADDPAGARPPVPVVDRERSLAEYCINRKEPVFIDRLREWRGTHQGKDYQVLSAEALERMGCVALECVPFFPPRDERRRTGVPLSGVVSSHFRDSARRVIQPSASLGIMAALTAQSIANAQMAEELEVQQALNNMALKYLTGDNPRPGVVRDHYLRDLIHLLKHHVHVGAVSIFYRDVSGESLECLATTGLRLGSTGEKIPLDDPRRAVYDRGEGLTGTCFDTGEARLYSSPRKVAGHIGKYLEMGDKTTDEHDPLLLCPIPRPLEKGSPKPKALGVIRCAQHWGPVFPDRISVFKPSEERLVEFIGRQVGPVLETLTLHIERENRIRIIKHDLAVPFVMVRDTAQAIRQALETKQEIRPYDLKDLTLSHHVAKNLIDQLDPEPGNVDLAAEPTRLEGDIVARVCNMLQDYAWNTNRMRFQFDPFHKIPALNIDRAAIERVFFNLLTNAVKYGTKDTTVFIGANVDETDFVVEISNQGIGVEPQDVPRLFTFGYRAKSARRLSHGQGYGLAIARKAMKAHGGDLLLSSLKNPTTFSLRFPRTLAATPVRR